MYSIKVPVLFLQYRHKQ